MIEYREQFRTCRSDGTTKTGQPETHQLAFPKRLKDGRVVTEITSTPYVCGKFGGRCSSGHAQCREMRGAEPMPATRTSME